MTNSILQVRKVPAEVQKEVAQAAKIANAQCKKTADKKNSDKTRMKGKNTAMKRHRKKQDNIIRVSCHFLARP